MTSVPRFIDVQVGLRLRLRRIELRLSQKKVADKLQVSFQQIQKYEKGSTRIAAGRLAVLSDLLKVTPTYFFEDHADHGLVAEIGMAISPLAPTPFQELVRLNEAFRRIADPSLRVSIIALIEAINARPNPPRPDL